MNDIVLFIAVLLAAATPIATSLPVSYQRSKRLGRETLVPHQWRRGMGACFLVIVRCGGLGCSSSYGRRAGIQETRPVAVETRSGLSKSQW
jgi:hypothetical protein